MRASEATGEERDRLYRDQAERRPQFAVELAGELSGAPGAGGEPIHEWLEVRLFMVEPSTVTEAPVR